MRWLSNSHSGPGLYTVVLLLEQRSTLRLGMGSRGKNISCLIQFFNLSSLSQVAAEDGGGAGSGVGWPRPSSGSPAAIVAKQVLLGRNVVVVRCEGINISRNLYRNKLKYLAFLRKQMNTNPS